MRWFAFNAFNTAPIYGYGTEAEAARYAEILNSDREINHYAAQAMADEDMADVLFLEDEGNNLAEEIAARRPSKAETAEFVAWMGGIVSDADLYGEAIARDLISRHDWSASRDVEVPSQYTIDGNPAVYGFAP